MLAPLIRRPRQRATLRSRERGVTMALVALAMVTIIAMAALSIDIGALYEAKAEAQRAADAAALTAARVISISGNTGATSATWGQICGGLGSQASLAAISMAQQNLISGVAVSSAAVSVKYGVGSAGATNTDCSGLGANFAVNPVVTVSLQSATLPIFFARVFSLFGSSYASTTAKATATAEVFNPSGVSPMVPVNPRCVKPWVVPNRDPGVGTCAPTACPQLVDETTGAILNAGISPNGVIDETLNLVPDCLTSGGRGRRPCALMDNPPVANSGATPTLPLTLDYVSGTSVKPFDRDRRQRCDCRLRGRKAQ